MNRSECMRVLVEFVEKEVTLTKLVHFAKERTRKVKRDHYQQRALRLERELDGVNKEIERIP